METKRFHLTNGYYCFNKNWWRGGGHRFLVCIEEDTIVSIKQKVIDELYFPNFKNKYGEEAQNCTINIQNAARVLVNEDKLLSTFCERKRSTYK